MRKFNLVLVVGALLIGACSTHVQTTSGAEYLARAGAPTAAETITHRRAVSSGGAVTETISIASTDELVRRAAAVEPLLTLPARIGLARIERGALTLIPPQESGVWEKVAARHAATIDAVPIDPFLADFTARTVLPQDRRALRRDAGDLITRIRLGAARQHVDAVLIYEVGTNVTGGDALPGLALVGTLGGVQLRKSTIGHAGVARALLLDVRNGYPYATISATADVGGIERPFWDGDANEKAYIEATGRIARALGEQVETALSQIVERSAARVAKK